MSIRYLSGPSTDVVTDGWHHVIKVPPFSPHDCNTQIPVQSVCGAPNDRLSCYHLWSERMFRIEYARHDLSEAILQSSVNMQLYLLMMKRGNGGHSLNILSLHEENLLLTIPGIFKWSQRDDNSGWMSLISLDILMINIEKKTIWIPFATKLFDKSVLFGPFNILTKKSASRAGLPESIANAVPIDQIHLFTFPE